MEDKGIERTTESPVERKRLPRDEFWGYSTWMLFSQRFTFLVFAIWIIIAVFLFRITIYIQSGILSFLLIMFDLLFAFFAVAFLFSTLADHGSEFVMTFNNRLHFLNEVIKNRPGLAVDKWDMVAANMNEKLISKSSYSNFGYFFDGNMCHKEFKCLFMRDSEASKYPELKKYIDDALRVYEADVDTFLPDNIQDALDRQFEGRVN